MSDALAATMTAENAARLREPFPESAVGKLPRSTRNDNPKGTCSECNGYHGLPAIHLDYVGHAATTDRLLTVDPTWTWEPLSLGPDGLPALDRAGNLWIKLTVCGVTRLGVGDGKSAKEAIGDAIRNAAMRFGVALDLWAKEDLAEIRGGVAEHAQAGYVPTAPPRHEPDRPAERIRSTPTDDPFYVRPPAQITADQRGTIGQLLERAQVEDKAATIAEIVGRPVASLDDLTPSDADRVITALLERVPVSDGDVPSPPSPADGVGPEPGEEVDLTPETAPAAPAKLTSAQLRLLQAAYKDMSREERLADASQILGRTVESFSDLTRAEAKKLIDATGTGS